MAHKVVLCFGDDLIPRPVDIPGMRNFGEDIWRKLRETKWGDADMDEIDRATSGFSIINVRNANLRRLTKWLEEELDRQNMHASIIVDP